MKKILIGALLVSITMTATWAKGPANKVTGDFVRVNDNSGRTYECEFTAHELKDNRIQKGSMYCSLIYPDQLNTWEVMLHNSYGCVIVVNETTARIGGRVDNIQGTATNLLGKFVGITVYDFGEPGAYVDEFDIHNFYDNEALYWEWCADGGALGDVSPYTLTDGNVQVHYYGE